ncbi:MAG TPA: lysophospholipid acyltransferase family protein [Acidocella sp.]|jgi:1-acyl-sn-glycerol-3-phosphate acyltransferase|uniref:lysophospholipid acyltransferase family protein n=1 Tax=Acidocella sp. TaxID=50710 RepID=UPI002C49CDE0|nr:lysophospholipid acyltransferase family protein [Acidocella sp.]HVE22120.1 lysophospholipid acyltransferase family protein [Acidocella sp.]
MTARLVVILAWTLLAMPTQALMLTLPGRAKVRFAMIYWRGVAFLLGLRLTVTGSLPAQRPVLFVANHCSWLDIVALGGVLPGCFVAKGAIDRWPFINWLARLGRTVFVSRNRDTVSAEQAQLEVRMAAGDNIILFPEGTTSDGVRILRFSTSFLALAETEAQPYVQPVTIVYDTLDGFPVRRHERPDISWYGDMDLASHYARLGRRRHLHATIILDEAIAPGTYANRKALTAALEERVAHNAASLRQGRDWR